MSFWRVYRTLEWFIFVGFSMATFFALVAVVTLVSIDRQARVVVWQQPQVAVTSVESPSSTDGWQMYRNEEVGFEFWYPVEWEIKRISSSYTKFINSSGAEMAALRCPIPETGYEVWNFIQESRMIKKNGATYKVQFEYGTPTYDDAEGDIAIVDVYDVAIVQSSGAPGGSDGSCQLLRYDARGHYGIFKAIYDSLE